MDKIVDCQRVTAGPPRWLTSLAAPLQALRNRLTFDLVRIVVALLLLGAAAAKWHQFQTGLAQSWSLQVMTILFEVVLGFWFLWGGNPRLLRRTGIGAFSVFACLSLAKGLAGFSSCGCFGEVAVSPWLIFLVDVGVVLALLVATPANSGDRALAVPRIQPTVWLCAPVLLGMLLLSATFQAPTQIGAGMTLLGGNSVLLDPDAWIGEELPLLQFIDIGDELRSGVWNLLLYRPGCQDCEQALREINEQSGGAHTTAIIVVPPHTGDLSVGSLCTLGHLDPDYTWHITTPVAFELRDGLVSRRQAAGGFTNPSFNTLSSAQ